MPTNIFIDTEYLYTAALREGKVPNYKSIIEIINKKYHENCKLAYFIGSKDKKKKISDFLLKLGVDFVTILDYKDCSKTQIVGSTIALDVMKLIYREENISFAFISGDDYLLPIINLVNKYNIKPDVYYFPSILTRGIDIVDCNKYRLADYNMFYKDHQ